jgi:hypothetical protein
MKAKVHRYRFDDDAWIDMGMDFNDFSSVSFRASSARTCFGAIAFPVTTNPRR